LARFALFGESSRRIAQDDSVAVIGLGQFGSALALELMESGAEVLGIDSDEDVVQGLSGLLTQVVRADSTKEDTLRQLSVHEFDRVVIAIGDDVQSSILTTSIVLGMKRPEVWAKAVNLQHGRILEQLGAHHVIHPEDAMGRRVAHLVRGLALDYLEIEPGYSLAKVVAAARILGAPLGELALARDHGVTVTARKPVGGEWGNADDATVLGDGDTILIVGPTERIEEFARLK
jgi:trk system potassium uptake protein TrkA